MYIFPDRGPDSPYAPRVPWGFPAYPNTIIPNPSNVATEDVDKIMKEIKEALDSRTPEVKNTVNQAAEPTVADTFGEIMNIYTQVLELFKNAQALNEEAKKAKDPVSDFAEDFANLHAKDENPANIEGVAFYVATATDVLLNGIIEYLRSEELDEAADALLDRGFLEEVDVANIS